MDTCQRITSEERAELLAYVLPKRYLSHCDHTGRPALLVMWRSQGRRSRARWWEHCTACGTDILCR